MIHVEVWSDIVCPFCYIGKRVLAQAVAEAEMEHDVQVVWKSFQLDPAAERSPRIGTHERLARKYGRSLEWARQMTAHVEQRAASVGLTFNLERAIPANSLDAHRLVHLAAERGLRNQMLERLFAAHFTDGLNVGDHDVLRACGLAVGLEAGSLDRLLASDEYAAEVRHEDEEARALGISGVPFFLFNRRYAVSGAQAASVFRDALRTAAGDLPVPS